MIAINSGHSRHRGFARSFIEAFPDIQVFMDDLAFTGEAFEHRWTFTGTSSKTGKWVRMSGAETWTIGEDGLIAASKDAYDEAENERQVGQGAPW